MEHKDIFNQLNYLAQMVPTPFYWLDLKGRFAGLNKKALEAIGAKKVEDVIGKNAYDIYPKELANIIWKDVQKVINEVTDSQIEDVIVDLTSGLKRYYTATRSPIIDSSGKVIGVIAASIETTDEKEAEYLRLENYRLENECLRLENEKHKALAKKHEDLREMLDRAFRNMQFSVMEYLNKDIGLKLPSISNENIVLTTRESQVIFALYHKKNAKSAANYLSKKLNKPFTNDSVNTAVSKCLYPKFGVNSIDELINKAILLKMIPLAFPEKVSKKEKIN